MTLPAPSVCLVVLDGWGLAPAPGETAGQEENPLFYDQLGGRPRTTPLTTARRDVPPDDGLGNYADVDLDKLAGVATLPVPIAQTGS